MSLHVSVDNVLRRRRKRLERGVELFPIASTVEYGGRVGAVFCGIQRGPAQRITLVIILEDDWAVTGNRHVMVDDVVVGTADSFPDLDLFATDDGILPTRRRLVTFRIAGLKLFQI